MTKELFISAIEAIQKQDKYDNNFADKLGEAFPDAFSANLLPKNHWLQNALIEILVEETKDTCGWIEYFCWELDFGKRNDTLKVTDKDGNNIPLSTPGELWEVLKKSQ